MKLSATMTATQFNRGYWYAVELKEFAKKIGIPSAGTLRKDELEQAIKVFLQTRKIVVPTERSLSRSRSKDVERGLGLDLRVEGYTNNKKTKDFLEREALRLVPGLKRKSGARYRLNRWREERIAKGLKITYRDLVEEYVRLSQTAGPFARIPHGRYINFMSDFMGAERNATRTQAIKAWKMLKTLDVPKDYRSWKIEVMPFKSQAQRRKFAQLLVEGKISPQTFEEWNRETGSKKLPDHVKHTQKRRRPATRKSATKRRR